MGQEEKIQPKIVHAVGTVAASEANPKLAQLMEQRMSEAVKKAIAEGIPLTDNEEIKKRMLAAQLQVRHELGIA